MPASLVEVSLDEPPDDVEPGPDVLESDELDALVALMVTPVESLSAFVLDEVVGTKLVDALVLLDESASAAGASSLQLSTASNIGDNHRRPDIH
ncbi:MAG: hypothetical protein IAG13_23250 [Deltaproteobacteria bacterium]|nr:hypothetical protein [Nannocystaceae bacterium]